VPESNRNEVEAAIGKLKEALQANDAAKIDAGIEALTKASHVLAEALYKRSASQQQGQPQGGQGGQPGGDGAAKPGGGKDENVVDAEFEEVKDHKA
jgi:molecular chaperone DnaK